MGPTYVRDMLHTTITHNITSCKGGKRWGGGGDGGLVESYTLGLKPRKNMNFLTYCLNWSCVHVRLYISLKLMEHIPYIIIYL